MLCCILLCMSNMVALNVYATSQTKSMLQLSYEEEEFALQTQEEPLEIGIIPHAFPLSDCPPDASDYVGINVDMLNKISEISGLNFTYFRIPIEEKTPYQLLQEGTIPLVAGTIKLDGFISNPELILSDRLCDGSAACITRKGTSASAVNTGKVAVMKGYQAGFEFAEELFPGHEIVSFANNLDVMKAVRKGTADFAIISRYVGIYEMQSPLNANLTELTLLKMEKDSCVMGINNPENQVAISIINKALTEIGEDGYNSAQMNFSLTNPYKLSYGEFIYKYRYILIGVVVALIVFCVLTVRLLYTQKEHKRLSFDTLTGALTEARFAIEATKFLPKSSTPLFVTDFDIYRFSSYNELNGKEKGDELLKGIVKIVKSLLSEQDLICRSYADHFKVLSSKDSLEHLIADIHKALIQFDDVAQSSISLNFGIYPVEDITVPVPKMLNFAVMAKKHIKNSTTENIGVFDEELLTRYTNEARMTAAFQNAIINREFVAYYQPKFDAAKKTIIGAEALVRWIQSDGVMIPPNQFVELFEKSGQIQQLDFYMLEMACTFLNKLITKGIPVLPIAVNFSRVHLYSDEFVKNMCQTVDGYNIPRRLIEIECTETTMINNVDLTCEILGSLQESGFSIAMDDFGSAYSSLNTLSAIPLDVLKLDSGFLLDKLSHERDKANIIIKSIMTLAHDLSLEVVAEGVETESQYKLLKSLGCDVIQGYYFSKPLDEMHFLELLVQSEDQHLANL